MTGRLGTQRGRRSARLGGGYKAQVMADSPLGYWRLDETSGTTIVDAANGHNGTISGTYTLNQPGAIAATDPGARSIKWGALSTYVAVPTGAWMNVTTAASWELWINPVTPGSNAGILSRYGNGGGGGSDWLLWYNTSSQVAMQLGGLGSAGMNMPQLNVWTHLVATYDAANIRLYCNGAQVAAQAITGSIATTAGDIGIGAYQSGGFGLATAYLDEVAFYGTTLTPARIMAHYNAGIGAM